jgi:hypothetical protein
MGARGCVPGSKVDGESVDLSPPASAEVKKWSYTCIPSTRLCDIYRDNFTFTSFYRNFEFERGCLNNNTLKCCIIKSNITECENDYSKYISS